MVNNQLICSFNRDNWNQNYSGYFNLSSSPAFILAAFGNLNASKNGFLIFKIQKSVDKFLYEYFRHKRVDATY